jgi:hypothetical protein
MQELTTEARQIVQNLAGRHGVSPQAVEVLLHALAAGNGYQAQFNHPELGGMGQWSQGGMIMIGDMFNQGLKYRVSQLCDELSGLLRNQAVYAPALAQSQFQSSGASLFVQGSGYGSWWPADLGSPAATGSQNDMSYAYFPTPRRLAIRLADKVRIYDTGDHAIGGVSQQQGGDQSLTFNSQYGVVRVSDLRLVSPAPEVAAPPAATTEAPAPASSGERDIFATIEKLATLRDKNILSEEEFSKKKAELLARL